MSSPLVDAAERELVLERTFDAPRDLVFDAWIHPNHLVHWWGPKGFTTTMQEFDLRPGGTWRFVMHGPDGVDYQNEIVYEEIVRPERLVYTHGPGEVGDLQAFHVTVTFAEQGGKTRLVLRLLFASAEERDKQKRLGAVEGGKSTLERLAEYLAQA